MAFLFCVSSSKNRSMTNFWRRLKYYGIGFGLGLIFVFFFFKNRGCSWTPSNRVKNAILDRVLVISDEMEREMVNNKLTTNDLVNVLDDGDVNFSKSDKDSESKVYLIEKKGKKYFFTLPAESFVSEVFIGKKVKKPISEVGSGKLIHFPNDDDLVYVDSNSVLTCQQNALGLIDPRMILKELKKNGRIDFEQSELSTRPKPVHHLTFIYKDKLISAKVIWYKNKLNVLSLTFEGDNCVD